METHELKKYFRFMQDAFRRTGSENVSAFIQKLAKQTTSRTKNDKLVDILRGISPKN